MSLHSDVSRTFLHKHLLTIVSTVWDWDCPPSLPIPQPRHKSSHLKQQLFKRLKVDVSEMYEHDITWRKYFEVTCLHIALASAHCLGGHDEVELLAQLNLAFVQRGFSEAVEDAPTPPPPLPCPCMFGGGGAGICWVACLITVRSCACLSGDGASWWADVGLLLLIKSPWPLFGLHWA